MKRSLHAITIAISRPSFELPGETLLVFIVGDTTDAHQQAHAKAVCAEIIIGTF